MNELFAALGLWGNVGAFAIAAASILVAGSKLERWAGRIGRITKLGEELAGMILLAVATSLPEIATTVTATLHGEISMAVNNLLGGVILQTMVLAFADVVGRRAALTGKVPSVSLLIEGVGLVLVLASVTVAAGLEAHFRQLAFLADAGPIGVAGVYLLMQYVSMRSREHPRWTPSEGEDASEEDDDGERADEDRGQLPKLLGLFLFGSVVVCIAGYVVVVATEHIAESTGASHSFLGFTVVAFATSLPEISTTAVAARRGHGVTAAANVFGSNSFDLALLALVAAIASGPIFAEALVPTVFAAGLGIVLTGVYLVGMLERKDRAILRMGWDSAIVVVLGFLGIGVMFAFGAR